MGIADRLKKSFRQLLQRPGATVSLDQYEALLVDIDKREDELKELSNAELTAAALALLPERSASIVAKDNDKADKSDKADLIATDVEELDVEEFDLEPIDLDGDEAEGIDGAGIDGAGIDSADIDRAGDIDAAADGAKIA
ncbi:MAG TPA: hypothetical protein VGF84_12855, partial [Micromonosporaceae bacterium]